MDKGGKESSASEEVNPDGNTQDINDSGLLRSNPGNVEPKDFFSRLSREEKQLLLLREELYDGSWDEMEADLRNRLDKKPNIFRLMNRIEEDLARIENIKYYETEHNVNLGLFLQAGKDDNK